MNGIQEVRLGNLVTISGGGTPTRSEPKYYGGNIPWVTPKDMKSWEIHGAQISLTPEGVKSSAARLIEPNAVLVVVRSGVLKHTLPVALNRVPVAINQDMKALRCSAELHPEYLARYLKAASHKILSEVRATTADNFPLSVLQELPIPLPPLPEQKRIAAILDAAEALREKRREAIARLDTLTQSTFVECFLKPEVAWGTVMLGEVSDILTGYAFKSQEYTKAADSFRLCRGANVLPGRMDWSDLAAWPSNQAADLGKFVLVESDVVIAMDRPWISEGFKVAQISSHDLPALLVQRVARVRGNDGIPNSFLFRRILQEDFTRHCRPTETTVPHISPRDIRSFEFALPPKHILSEYDIVSSRLENLRQRHRSSMVHLDTLFTSLQHRAFRGEL